ncbi:hypothetical protein COLO4_07426 [Corchorus olitorius]|uniref:Myb/SANT-like domain-containing protein n=1 Tax=Corchorus olitorius TaxID=93759 RepID=A0A1R3KJT5_9ROSI|nr:hypothetical protein COLO4_07426 [Corchorus olitorius]
MDRPATFGRVWTDDETIVLVEMMLGIGDARECWEDNKDILVDMIELSLPGWGITQPQVEARIKCLRREYMQIKKMLKSPVFYWDEVHHKVEGDQEVLDMWFRVSNVESI